MFKEIPLKKEHLLFLLAQSINQKLSFEFTPAVLDQIEKCGKYFTIMGEEPMVCGGVTKYWEGRGNLWCVINENSKLNFVPVFRAIDRFLDHEKMKYNRIELSIPYGFEKGIRRAQMLGFKIECERARNFLPDGTDCTTMVWLKGDHNG